MIRHRSRQSWYRSTIDFRSPSGTGHRFSKLFGAMHQVSRAARPAQFSPKELIHQINQLYDLIKGRKDVQRCTPTGFPQRTITLKLTVYTHCAFGSSRLFSGINKQHVSRMDDLIQRVALGEVT